MEKEEGSKQTSRYPCETLKIMTYDRGGNKYSTSNTTKES